jgi:hypothetical protein
VVLDLQDLDDPGQELRLATQIVAFGADAGQVQSRRDKLTPPQRAALTKL